MTEPVILIRRQSLNKANRYAPWLVLALMIATFGGIVLVFWDRLVDDPKLWERLLQALLTKPEDMAMLLVVAAVSLYQAFVLVPGMAQERIVINADGIEYRAPAAYRLLWFASSWNIPWNRLKKAEMSSFLGAPQPMILLHDGRRARRLLVDAWVVEGSAPEAFSFELFKTRLKRPSPEQLRQRLEASPIVQALRARGFAVTLPAGEAVFDLLGHPRTRMAVVLVLALGIYGGLDGIVIEETYAEGYPWMAWTGAGTIAALLAQRWLVSAKVPVLTASVLAVMLGGSVGLAAFPALLRLNQLTDTEGAQAREYVLRQFVRLEPVEAGLPAIEFHDYSEYWSQFRLDSTHTLYLRRGGFGFYQIDLAPLHDTMQAFYKEYYACRAPAAGAPKPAAAKEGAI